MNVPPLPVDDIPMQLFPGLVPPLPGLVFRPVEVSALNAAHKIESASYPPDEAASRAKLELRMTQAAPYFWGAFDAAALDAGDEGGALRGFVCGTLTLDQRLSEESMSVHQPEGRTLCIHSVVVPEALRRHGLGGWMLRSYLERVAEAGRVELVQLLCKVSLEHFYASAGFESLGDSGVAHGADPWTLMWMQLPAGREEEAGAGAVRGHGEAGGA
jgi:predicted GNAT family N-acyltransferase